VAKPDQTPRINKIKILESIKSRNLDTLAIVAVMFFLCILAYGVLIPWMGYYWDDWGFAWTAKFLGPMEFIPSFLPFRPFLGPIFAFTTSILGISQLTWQVFGLLVRFGTGLAALFAMRSIWPKARLQTSLASLFFVVFPGYNQQWIALTHTNQEMLSLCAYLLSLGYMIKAVRAEHKNKIKNSLIAFALTFFGLYTTEYFVGLELLRPIILWFVLLEINSNERMISRVFRTWLPYLLIWISNLAFLFWYHNSAYYNSYGLTAFKLGDSGIVGFITSTIEDFIQSFITTGFNSWTNTLSLVTNSLLRSLTWFSFIVIGVSFLVVFIAHNNNRNIEVGTYLPSNFGWQALLLGGVGILMGRIPSWLAGLPLQIEFSWDRFMISMMLGGSLFFLGLVDYLIQDNKRELLIASILISLAVGWQFTKANTYRLEWQNQKQFFWQLNWRVPSLKPGTLVVTHELPFEYVTDLSLSAALNWIYAPEIHSHELPYMLVYTKARLHHPVLPALKPGLAISYDFRTMKYTSNTDQALVIFQENPGCLRILDPVYANKDTLPGMTYMLTDAVNLSNLNLIDTNSPGFSPPTEYFGKEPAHDWCYFFEKAELARQSGDWSEVARLGNEAELNKFSAISPVENLPFIEAYALTGQIDRAVLFTNETYSAQPELQPALCGLWQRVTKNSPDIPDTQEIQDKLACGS
jgi:hypothetical protein